MAKIKHTKNELKSQRDALRRYTRYLPTLQLKKQQLQLEVRQIEVRLEQKEAEEQQLKNSLQSWVRLFSEPVDLSAYLQLEAADVTWGNIAGVNIPVLQDLVLRKTMPDLFMTDPWVDDALKVLESLIRLRVECRILAEQKRLVAEELRTTTQRVNLFERVKIPESQENIRVIRIFLGDLMTSEVARAKIAKGKTVERLRSSA